MNRDVNATDSTELGAIGDFCSRFSLLTEQEQAGHLRRFSEELRSLSEGIDHIHLDEWPSKLEGFRRGLVRLDSAVREAREKGFWRKTRFNIFQVLNCEQNENTQSNLLAWLLTPEEAHGLNDSFLHSFLNKVFEKDLNSRSPIRVMRKAKQDNGRPTIVIQNRDWQIVIENKLYSGEGREDIPKSSRTHKASDAIDQRGFQAWFTLRGEELPTGSFHKVSYKTIADLLRELPADGDASVLLCHFMEYIYSDIR